MENFYVKNKLEQIKRGGYGLNLESVLSDAFDIHKKAILPGIIAIFINFFIIGIVTLSMFGILYEISFIEFIESSQRNPQAMEVLLRNRSLVSILSYSFVYSLAVALLAPFVSGLYEVARLIRQTGEAPVSALFAFYKQPYFLNIFIYSLVFGFIFQFSQLILSQQMPAFGGLLGTLVQIVITVSLILTIPLIVFGKMSWLEAMSASFSITSKNWFFLLFILFISFIISILGIFLCGIGVVLTYPFLYFTTFILYDKILGFENQEDIISKIGEE